MGEPDRDVDALARRAAGRVDRRHGRRGRGAAGRAARRRAVTRDAPAPAAHRPRDGRADRPQAGPGGRVINLYSDTQTRPTAAMREAMAARRGRRRAVVRRPDRQRALRAGGGAARLRGGRVPAERDDVQRDRVPAAHRARRRRGLPAPPLAPDRGGGRRAGRAVGRGAVPARRRARHVHRGRAARRAAARRRPLPAALAARVGRADHEPLRRARVAARAALRGRRGRARRRPAAAHGRRAADERGRRERALGRLVDRRVRHRVGRLLEGARARRSAPAWRARAS